MKIAIVSPYSWTVPGGVNMHIASLAHQLRTRGHEVRILAPADGPVEAGVLPLGRTVAVPYNGSVARMAFGPRVAARVRVALRRARPDIVHVHEPFSPSTGMLTAIAARVPVVATFHASADSRAYRVARTALTPLWNKLSVKIAVSAAARDTVEGVFGPGVRIIPNGIDCARFAAVGPPDPDGATVLYVGRLERRKGAHVLVDAVPSLLETVATARVVFAGDGPLRKELEQGVTAKHRARVEFIGRFAEEDRLALLESSNVVCLPAIGGESFGYTLVEAMAAGRAVVASAIPGYASVARDGLEAVLVPPGRPEAVAGALARLLAAPHEAAAMGAAARARAKTYDWPVVAGDIEEVYREALDRAAPSRTRRIAVKRRAGRTL